MNRLLLLLPLILLLNPASVQARERSDMLSEEQLIAQYGDASDEISAEEASELLLGLVNYERESRGLSRLSLLRTAGFMARRHAGDMARRGYGSHLDTDGRNPVERYNRLGGTDYVQENLIVLDIDWPLRLTQRLVHSFHQEWMDSPEHRATVLLPQATHMGAAFELERNGISSRMAGVCEFVCERGDYSRLPQLLDAGDALQFSGQLQAGTELAWIALGLQPQAVPHSIEELNTGQDSYVLPEASFLLTPEKGVALSPDAPAYLLEVNASGDEFNLELRSMPDWAGQTLYVYVFARSAEGREPECVACQTVELKG